MDLIWKEMACLHMLCLVVFASCTQGNDRAELTSPAFDAVYRFRRLITQKQLRSHFLSLQKNAKQKEQDTGHKIHRVRRSWLSDYLDDLWSHIYNSFPRGALYAFPVALVIMFLLCCATILLE